MYQRAKDFLDDIKKNKGNPISFEVLKTEMTMKLGADKSRTIKPYLKMMDELGMIKEVGENVIII